MEHGPEDIHAQNPLFGEVVKMYREYKRQYVKNIGFNETAFSTIFGEFQSWCFNSLFDNYVQVWNRPIQLFS